jgi:hypothetical protein
MDNRQPACSGLRIPPLLVTLSHRPQLLRPIPSTPRELISRPGWAQASPGPEQVNQSFNADRRLLLVLLAHLPQGPGECILQRVGGLGDQRASGVRCADVHHSPVSTAAPAFDKTLCLKPVQHPNDRARTQVDLPGGACRGSRFVLGDGCETQQLGAGDLMLGRQPSRTDVNGPGDPPDCGEDPSGVAVFGHGSVPVQLVISSAYLWAVGHCSCPSASPRPGPRPSAGKIFKCRGFPNRGEAPDTPIIVELTRLTPTKLAGQPGSVNSAAEGFCKSPLHRDAKGAPCAATIAPGAAGRPSVAICPTGPGGETGPRPLREESVVFFWISVDLARPK